MLRFRSSDFQRLIHFLIHEPFLETDEFSQTCRKIIFTVSMLIWPIIAIGIFLDADQYNTRPTATAASHIDGMLFVIWIPVFYCIMRKYRHISDNVMTSFVVLSNLAFSFQIFRTTISGTSEYLTIVMTTAVASQIPRVWCYVVLGLLTIAIHYYNVAAVNPNSSMSPLMFSGEWVQSMPCPNAGISTYVINLAVIAMTISVVRLQTKAFTDQLNTAKQNLDVTRDVAEYLANYNTSEARTSLSKHIGGGDPKLMAYLTMIVDNMDKYRPYLPNYLLRPILVEENEPNDQDKLNISASDKSTGSSPRTPQTLHNISPPQTAFTSPFTRRNSAAVQLSIERPITMCGILFNDVFDTTLLEAAQVQRVTDFVDRIHNIAFDHCGAVHSFLGDVCIMSWNVATRCVNHEVRAVTSVMCLKDNSRAFGLEYVVAGIVSGRGRCQLGGTSTVACTLHAPNVTRLHGAVMCHATRIHSVVCDDTVCRAVEHSAITQSVEAVTFEQRLDEKANSVFLLHEVLRLLKHDDDEDREWMYRMQQSNGPQRKVNEALRKALAGEVATALALLEEVEAADAMTSGSKCLQSKLKSVSMLPALIVYPFMRM